MKSFLRFSAISLFSIILTLVIIYADSESFHTMPELRACVLIGGLLLITAFAYVYVFEKTMRKHDNIIRGLAVGCAFVFFGLLFFTYAASFVFEQYDGLKVSFFQAVIFVCVFILYVAVASLYQAYLQKAVLSFPERPVVYLRIGAVVCATVILIMVLTTSDEIWDDTFNAGHFISFFKKITAMSVFTTAISFTSLYLLNKVSFLRNKLVPLVAFTTIICTFFNMANPFIEASVFMLQLIGYGIISFFISVSLAAIVFYRNTIILKNRDIAALTTSFSRKEAEYTQLKNQINPHFLFNNLNTLISFIETDKDKAVAFGHHLSNVYRHYLKNQQEDFVSLKEELSFIAEYLAVYKAKFDSGFTFEFHNRTEQRQYILSASLQELIDNVFKHNYLEESNPLKITISIQGDYLDIENTIHAKPNLNSNFSGLQNINSRYKILTGKEIMVEKSELFFKVSIPVLILENA